VDFKIETGMSELDESLVTGESLPRAAVPGLQVFAGSVNLSQPLTGRATAAADDSLLSDVARMLEAGEQRRSQFRRLADKAVNLYVPLVHTTALLAFLSWMLAGAGAHKAIMIAVSTLIITCPCALALAAPVTQVVAAGRLFRSGIFLKSGDALERLATSDHIVFDKTGTLTLGVPKLKGAPYPGLLADAAALARASRHPFSRALADVAGPGPIAQDVKEHTGLGLEGTVDGEPCRLGSAAWVGMTENAESASLWFVRGNAPPVRFQFEDTLRADAANTVAALRRQGFDLEILSGDRGEAVAQSANALGIADWCAAATPHVKAERLEELRHQGRHVLMIGDGLNDAGALALAHASAAPGGAMDVSQSASDAVYAGGLASLPQLITIARGARQIMLQNFWFAALYNAVAVPIALAGYATPLVAALAMSGSSLIVCLNALRLASIKEART
jgi:Cu2+-exporting ATPase